VDGLDEETLNSWKSEMRENDSLGHQRRFVGLRDPLVSRNDLLEGTALSTLTCEDVQLHLVSGNDNYSRFFFRFKGRGSTPFIVHGVTEAEDRLSADVQISGPMGSELVAFACDFYAKAETYLKRNSPAMLQFSGWGLFVSQQRNPLELGSPDGKKITTAGSSILLPGFRTEPDEYLFQFRVERTRDIIFMDTITITAIETKLMNIHSGSIPLTLYVSESALLEEYYPRPGDDITGALILCCNVSEQTSKSA